MKNRSYSLTGNSTRAKFVRWLMSKLHIPVEKSYYVPARVEVISAQYANTTLTLACMLKNERIAADFKKIAIARLVESVPENLVSFVEYDNYQYTGRRGSKLVCARLAIVDANQYLPPAQNTELELYKIEH